MSDKAKTPILPKGKMNNGFKMGSKARPVISKSGKAKIPFHSVHHKPIKK